jgi:DNA repair protein RadA/Sms
MAKAKEKTIWCCKECGNTQPKWSGSCSACHQWNTFVEEVSFEREEVRFQSSKTQISKPVSLSDVKVEQYERLSSHWEEFNRLVGGGLVPGSLLLVAGDPGIGKSTMMLQLCDSLSRLGLSILYICGEESLEQTSLRAKRLGLEGKNLFLFSETNFTQIKREIEQLSPDILIVDSIQIIYKPEIPSAPGAVTQVRELATEFMHIAKGQKITTFLIGHVTKSGDIAGPRVLEHIVDTVLEFEGDKQHGYRILRAVKNRFGPTDDIALFRMDGHGLKEVENPSEIFLQQRVKQIPGTVVVPTLEGTRSLLIEVQSLVVPSSYPTSSRRSSGLDQNRLGLLLAVLERKMNYRLNNSDVFVSVTGGMKISEPAIDLGVLMSIASSYCDRLIDPDTVIVGEVGLGGEVRSVTRVGTRVKEAAQMGFKRCILPARSLKEVSKDLASKITLIGVDLVEEAIDELLR